MLLLTFFFHDIHVFLILMLDIILHLSVIFTEWMWFRVCRGLFVRCVWLAVAVQTHSRNTLTPFMLMTAHPVSLHLLMPSLRSVFYWISAVLL